MKMETSPHVGKIVDIEKKYCNARLCWCKNYGVHDSDKMMPKPSIYCTSQKCWCHTADPWHTHRLKYDAQQSNGKDTTIDEDALKKNFQIALSLLPEDEDQIREAFNETLGLIQEKEDLNNIHDVMLRSFMGLSNDEEE